MLEWKILLNQSRPRPSTSLGDHRAEFERDYDRTIFSTPVKRLQDKAQVFPLEPHDAIRTRLTHSLEVSTVARGLVRKVAIWMLAQGEIEPEMERSIEAIAATCGLIHDLGNPPFGHAGEDAIRFWFKRKFSSEGNLTKLLDNREQLAHDFLLFEGNAQSLRIVTKLQILADFHGLNLTYGTLSASCKYLASSNQAGSDTNHAFEKPGFFASEASIVQDIRRETGTGDARNPITFLVEAADDIVYSVVDVEDGIKKGILTWREVQQKIEESGDDYCIEAINRTKKILHVEKEDDLNKLGLPDDIYASAFRTAAIGVLIESAAEEFTSHYSDIMSGVYKKEMVEDCRASNIVTLLKKIGKRQVYSTPSILKLELLGRKVICDLMDLFWEGAEVLPIVENPKPREFTGKLGALFSENYRRVFQHSASTDLSLPQTYHRLQLVTDYVCGMTDSFAQRLHAELHNGA